MNLREAEVVGITDQKVRFPAQVLGSTSVLNEQKSVSHGIKSYDMTRDFVCFGIWKCQ